MFQTYLIAAGAQVFWRDPEYATDASTSISAIQEFIKHHLNVDYLMLVQCTTPFLKTDYILEAISQLTFSSTNTQCVFSVTRYKIKV